MHFDYEKFRIVDRVRKNILVQTDQGMLIVNRFDKNKNNDGQGIWLLDHGNVSTFEAQVTFDVIKKDNPVIIDVGGNIGTYCTWVSMKYPNGTIYSIEPQRLIFQMLCGNLAINNLENVITLNMALGEFDGFIEIPEPDYTKDDNFGSYSLVSDFANLTGRKFKVEMLKLDSLIDRYEIDKIDLIKIDCEGMDYNVLLGAQNSIKKYKPYIIIEYCNDVFDQKDIISKFFEENNYKVFEFQHNFLAHPA